MFAALLAGTVAAPKIAVTKSAWSQPVTKKSVYYGERFGRSLPSTTSTSPTPRCKRRAR